MTTKIEIVVQAPKRAYKARKPIKRVKVSLKTKKPLKKAKSVSKLKKKADAIFSKFIRASNANSDGIIQCYTCPFIGPVSKMQNGHLVSRYYLATRYDERNCRPQCITCNVWRNGRVPEFAAKLQKELGNGIVEELYEKARTLIKDFDYKLVIETYTEKYQSLLEHG